jgi:hypothetical protein
MKKIIVILLTVFILFSLFQRAFEQNFVKADNVQPWQHISDPGGDMRDFEVDPLNPDHMFVGCFYGSDKWSFDGGKTWHDFCFDAEHNYNNMLTTRVFCINGVWYFNNWETIWKTTDFSSFEKVVRFKKEVPAGVEEYTVDDFWTDGTIFFVGFRANGMDGRALYRSVDGGKTWEDLTIGIKKAVGATPNFLGVSYINFIKKGTLQNNPDKDILFIWISGSPNNHPALYSVDDGESFQIMDPVLGLPDKIGNKLLADTWDHFLYESKDGVNWQIINKDFNFTNFGGFEYDSVHDNIYLVDAVKGVYYSQDGGKTWIKYYSDNLNLMPGRARIKVRDSALYLVMNGSFYTNSVVTTRSIILLLRIGDPNFSVNGVSNTLDSPPIIKNGRTLLPIRPVIEALGGSVSWDPTEKKVTVSLGSNTIELWIGKPTANINGVSKPIDSTNSKVVPEIINGRTMLPLRFVTDNLGCDVQWDGPTQTITIIYSG